MKPINSFLLISTLAIFLPYVYSNSSSSESLTSDDSFSSSSSSNRHAIEGQLIFHDKRHVTNEFLSSTQIYVNGGEHIGFLKDDGTFTVNGLAPGSYIVNVISPSMSYEAARVDITSKGKIRARKVNHLQPAQVAHIPYPLRLTPTGPYRYFQQREQWRITDILLSPMVLMMVLPLILIVILPKMMSDEQTRKEMEQVQLPKYEMPEMSEMLTNLFGGKTESSKSLKIKFINYSIYLFSALQS